MKKTMKKLAAMVLAGVTAVSMAGCGGAQKTEETKQETVKESEAGTLAEGTYDGKEYNLQLGHHMQTEHSTHKYAEAFKKNVEELSNGKIKVTIYPAGQLGGQADNTEAVRLGSLDMTISDLPSIATLYTAADIIGLPYLFKDMEHAERFYDSDRFQEFKDDIAAQTGVKVLSNSHSGMRMVYSQNPINTVADMKNLKIRVPEIPVYVDTFSALGCSTTPIPFSEIYTSLQTGVVDAVELPPEGFYTSSLYEVTKSMAVTNHIYCDMALLMNNDVFESMEPAAQAIVEKAAQEAALEHRELVKSDTEKLIADIKDKGLTVTEPSFEEFQNATSGVWESYIKNNAQGQELIDFVKSLE